MKAAVAVIKTVAWPREHGGWGLLAEGLLAGLLLCPTNDGLWIAVLVIAGFLTSQPLTIWLKDRRSKVHTERTVVAVQFLLIYGIWMVTCMAVLFRSPRPLFWLPLGMAAVMFIIQLIYTLNRARKELLPELLGALALGAPAAAIVIAGGWPVATAFLVWAILGLRVWTSVVYVRNKVDMDRRQPYSWAQVYVVHLAAVAAILSMAARRLVPPTIMVGMIILFLRAFYGMIMVRKQLTAQQVGMREVAFGLCYVASMIAGPWIV